MWGEFFTMTQWERSSILYLCWIKGSFKEASPGKLFPQHVLYLPIPSFIYLDLFLPFLISWKLKSCKFERIKSLPADWIVSYSVSGCIKRLRLWMYKTMMDASPLHLDCSELTSAEVRRKRASLIYRAGQLKETRAWMTDSPTSFVSFFFTFALANTLEESKSFKN